MQVSKANGCCAIKQQKQKQQKQQKQKQSKQSKQTSSSKTCVSSLFSAGAVSVDGVEARIPTKFASQSYPSQPFAGSHARSLCVGRIGGRVCKGHGRCNAA